jgi:hypothetical protein
LLLAAVGRTGTAKSESTGSYPTRRLKPSGWCGEGSWIDGRHPNAGLVDFEEVGHERVEINVGIREVVEG